MTRIVALRADITPQVARIDAHLLNRKGVARLCYCGQRLCGKSDRSKVSCLCTTRIWNSRCVYVPRAGIWP